MSIEETKKYTLFVYGTLKRGGRWYNIFDLKNKSVFIEDFELKNYAMYDLGGIPGINRKPEGKVIGELIEVGVEEFNSILHLEIGAGYNLIELNSFVLSFNGISEIFDRNFYTFLFNCDLSDTRSIESGIWPINTTLI